MNKLRNTLFLAVITFITLGDNAAWSEAPFKVPLQTRKEWNFEKVRNIATGAAEEMMKILVAETASLLPTPS